MNILRLVEKLFIRFFLIVILFPLQSCSNTFIGEKLEKSFDTTENTIISEKINNKPQKTNDIPNTTIYSTNNDTISNNSNVSFNNSKNFSIYNQTTNNNISRKNESFIHDESKSNQDTSSPSFKDRINQIEMK